MKGYDRLRVTLAGVRRRARSNGRKGRAREKFLRKLLFKSG
jgi:hypothetical protein